MTLHILMQILTTIFSCVAVYYACKAINTNRKTMKYLEEQRKAREERYRA